MIFMMMGPRQMAGASRSTMKPSDMSLTPCPRSGWILPSMISGLVIHAHHARDVGTVDVAVHQPHAVSRAHQRGGDVRGDGGLPTPPLPDEIASTLPRFGWAIEVGAAARPDARQGCAPSPSPSPSWFHDVDRHGRYAGHRLHGLAHLADQRAGILAGQHEREGHRALLVHDELRDGSGREEIGAEPGCLKRRERAFDLCLERVEGARAETQAPRGKGAT